MIDRSGRSEAWYRVRFGSGRSLVRIQSPRPLNREPVAFRAVNIADLRRLAQRRLPRIVFDYADGGAEDEITMRGNCRVFDTITFRPRSAVRTPRPDLRTTILGTPFDLPFMLAPIGSTRMFYPHGEALAAAAAGAAGAGYILSTLCGSPLEEVKAAATRPVWYQLYLVGGHDVARAGIERARKAGFSALVVTIDTPVAGMRERDHRNGTSELLTRNPFTMLPFVPQFLSRPRWLARFIADGGLMNFPNVMLPSGPMAYADVGSALEQCAVSWDDFQWIRDAWKGPIVVKGVHTADDARKAADAGADGVVVSNHGGRQLDGVSPTLRVLPEVVAAVGNRLEVLFDGGIRRGSDIVKALALGARAVLVGRAYIYGLGAAGGRGVTRAIEILGADVSRTMKLLGCGSIAEIDRSFLELPSDWPSAPR